MHHNTFAYHDQIIITSHRHNISIRSQHRCFFLCLCLFRLFLRFRVQLADFVNGIKFSRIRIDPFRLFKLSQLLEKVLAQVGLHQFFVKDGELIEQAQKLLHLRRVSSIAGQGVVLPPHVLSQRVHVEGDVLVQRAHQQDHCSAVVLHEITPDHDELLRDAGHASQLVHQLPHQGAVYLFLPRETAELLETRDQTLQVAQVRFGYLRYQKYFFSMKGLVLPGRSLRSSYCTFAVSPVFSRLALSVEFDEGVAAEEEKVDEVNGCLGFEGGGELDVQVQENCLFEDSERGADSLAGRFQVTSQLLRSLQPLADEQFKLGQVCLQVVCEVYRLHLLERCLPSLPSQSVQNLLHTSYHLEKYFRIENENKIKKIIKNNENIESRIHEGHDKFDYSDNQAKDITNQIFFKNIYYYSLGTDICSQMLASTVRMICQIDIYQICFFIQPTIQIQLGNWQTPLFQIPPKTCRKQIPDRQQAGRGDGESKTVVRPLDAEILILNCGQSDIIICRAKMEKRFRIKPKLSFTPGKALEGVYRVRLGKWAGNLPQTQIWETLEGGRGASLSPRKGKPAMLGLFRGARRIEASETFLVHDKTHRQSHTKGSSSPQGLQGSQGHEQARLARPLGMARNNRSMSGGKLDIPRGKAIQRTVSIVIEGAKAGGEEQRELMDTLSRIILGEDGKEDFLIEFLGESSIHGEELNFVDLDSRLLTEEVTPDQSVIEI